jgi:hypothetical protein
LNFPEKRESRQNQSHLKKKCNYSAACGTSEVAREPRRDNARELVSVFMGEMHHGVGPDSDNRRNEEALAK